MKNSRIYFIVLMICHLTSCTQEDSFEYNGGSQIYINTGDSTFFSFAVKPTTHLVQVINIPVKVSGMSVDYDREIDLEIVKEKTSAKYGTLAEGGYFTIDKAFILKDSVNGVIKVNLQRHPDLKKKNYDLCFSIHANGEFNGAFGGAKLIYKIGLNDILTIPRNWNSFIKTYFGTASLTKYQFVIDVLGIAEFPSSGEGMFEPGDMYFFKDKLKTELAKYKKEHGPLIDENGNEVSFG